MENPQALPPSLALPPQRVLGVFLDGTPSEPVMRTLAQGGWPAEAAETFGRAVDLLHAADPQVLLLAARYRTDLARDQLWTLLDARKSRKIPVILLSGEADIGAMLTAVHDGADAVLAKPLHFDRLFRCVRHLQELRSRRT